MGIRWLLKEHRDLIDAEFALNEGGGVGLLNGKPLVNGLQTSEKVPVSYRLEVKNPGGHSSLPSKDNAIYRMANGLVRLARFDFPFKLNETTRGYFERMAALVEPPIAADMRAIVAPTPDAAAVDRLSKIVQFNAQMRTTCVATMLQGGHAINALPQTVSASVNCRVLPGEAPGRRSRHAGPCAR
jgi:acetylornithine deacetylase/succinyl-diaminopimelate desuccinylase-like protein